MCNILYTFVPSPDSFLNLLCTEIIFHQEEEIEYMVSWLQARNRTAGTPCSAITSTDNTMMPGMMPAAAPTAMTMPGMTPAAAPTTMHMPTSTLMPECGVDSRLSDEIDYTVPGGLKYGVTVEGDANANNDGRRRMSSMRGSTVPPRPRAAPRRQAMEGMDMGGMVMGCGNTSCLSSDCFIRENEWMHDQMSIAFTCEPNVDFVRGMIPHHQGAGAARSHKGGYTK